MKIKICDVFLRMSFSELFSSSFLFSIGIVVVLIGVAFAYMTYRISDQDHKISSMVSLVSTMAEELQFFRNKLSSTNSNSNSVQQMQINPLYNAPNFQGGNNLIEVSDDEDETSHEGDETSHEGDETSDDYDDSDSSQDDDGSQDSDNQDDDDDDNIKSIHLDEEQLHDNEADINTTVNDDIIDLSKLPIPHIDEEHKDNVVTINDNENDNEDLNLKSISISEEFHDDFKKMSLPKLRSLVVEKGLVADASKLKKGELLKLLEDE